MRTWGVPRWLKLSLLGYVLLTAASLVLAVLAELPTRESSLGPAPSAFVMRDGRREGIGCGLNQHLDGARCEMIHTSTRAEEVEFDSRLTEKYLPRLHGTLTLPEGLDGPRPAVVLIHGSGPQTRDEIASGEITRPDLHAPFLVFKALAKILGEQGLVVLRYDKRSCVSCYERAFKHKSVDFTQFRFSDFADDARDALDYLATRPEVDSRRLVVLGHSQGGMLAPHVAHGDSRVAAVVSLAGATQNMMQGIVGQLREMATIRRRQWDVYGAWILDLSASKYEACFSRLQGAYDPTDPCMGGGITLRALEEEKILADSTSDTWADLACPALVVHGTLDRNVHPRVAADLAVRLRTRDAEVHLIDGTGHLLDERVEAEATGQGAEIRFDPRVVAALSAFLGSVRSERP